MEACPAAAQPEDWATLDAEGQDRRVSGALRLPCSPKTKARRRKVNKGHVHWDEQAIAEHDKERGTRQKIDEPDTPYVRSPQTASDSEGGPASSDDEHHRGVRSSHDPAVASKPPKAAAIRVEDPASDTAAEVAQPAQEVDFSAVGSRLDDWVRMGGKQRRISHGGSSAASSDGAEYAADAECSRPSSVCSSRSSSSAPFARHADASADVRKHGSDRRIVLPEDSSPPRQASSDFRAKRAQHYNEFKALRAFKLNDKSSTESEDTSDEEGATTRTNTNTNINQTISSKAVETRRSVTQSDGPLSVAAVAAAAAAESCEGLTQANGLVGITGATDASSMPPASDVGSRDGTCSPDAAALLHHQPSKPKSSSAPAARGSKSSRSGGASARGVSFSGGESGGDSTDEFRRQRGSHYQNEYRQARAANVTSGSLETNTNTNLNAGHGRENESKTNPMEAKRPPVTFGQGDSSPSQERDGGAGGSAPHQENSNFRNKMKQHYAREANAARLLAKETVSSDSSEDSSADSPGARRTSAASAQRGSQANPMEPRETGCPP